MINENVLKPIDGQKKYSLAFRIYVDRTEFDTHICSIQAEVMRIFLDFLCIH